MSSPLAAARCTRCGAKLTSTTAECWLCSSNPAGQGPTNSVIAKPVEPFSFSLNSLMMLVTLAAVCFGLLAAAPGLGVFVCVILLPVMIRTALVVRRREAAGLDVSPGTKVGLFFGSFAAASVIAVVVAGAAFGSFCLSCLGAFAVTNGRSESLALTIAFVVAGAVTLLISIPMAKWVKRRYRRDSTVD